MFDGLIYWVLPKHWFRRNSMKVKKRPPFCYLFRVFQHFFPPVLEFFAFSPIFWAKYSIILIPELRGFLDFFSTITTDLLANFPKSNVCLVSLKKTRKPFKVLKNTFILAMNVVEFFVNHSLPPTVQPTGEKTTPKQNPHPDPTNLEG